MILDAFVEARLRDGGVVDFAVTVAAIADEVDDDIAAKLRAILGGELSNPHDGVGIFAIDVKDGNGLALGDSSEAEECSCSGRVVKPIKLLTTM